MMHKKLTVLAQPVALETEQETCLSQGIADKSSLANTVFSFVSKERKQGKKGEEGKEEGKKEKIKSA